MTTALRLRTVPFLALLAVLVLSSLVLGGTTAAQDQDAQPEPAAASAPRSVTADEAIARLATEDGRLLFDVAEDMTRFAFAPGPVDEDGLPARGNAFVTQGYIYPYGTLSGSNGVLADGSPEFPDKVLGEWTCRGWYVGEGATTKSGQIVITTQLYAFGSDPGTATPGSDLDIATLGSDLDIATLVSDGYELADVGVEIDRAITGGTGPYATARGEAQQTLLGLNASEGVNLRFELEIRK